ncbi:hypothetical protein BB558_000687 [Smittium angustum]|uniref:Anaphase-promoting complex subunit 4 WD40 domain-containing protein n=1 Tax=Smittium angustum TaxID=133377 RepID=A0A2U1JDS6_SMIAN|nr:hypothetical protein BB558_000687 [Smittium angustum]
MNLSLTENQVAPENSEEISTNLLFADFNQDYGCFSIGTDDGFKIFNSDPFKEKMSREFDEGGIGNVTMLYRSNFLALVGGGRNPQFPPNKVMLWDDSTRQIISELEFRSDVRRVMLRKDMIIVLLRSKCIVCTLEPQPQKLHAFETCDNIKGIGSISTESESGILVFPGRQKGQIQVVELNQLSSKSYFFSSSNQDTNSNTRNSVSDSLENSEPLNQVLHPANINIIVAHTSNLSALSVSSDGTLIASASEKGTLIRVFSSPGGVLLYELRRGVDRANIYSLAFSTDATRLCVSSDKGTVHIFNLELGGENQSTSMTHDNSGAVSTRGNRQSSLSFFKGILPKYFSSEWSFAHFRVQSEVRCICGFSPNRDYVIVICANGVCEKYSIGALKGQCTREWTRRFI